MPSHWLLDVYYLYLCLALEYGFLIGTEMLYVFQYKEVSFKRSLQDDCKTEKKQENKK